MINKYNSYKFLRILIFKYEQLVNIETEKKIIIC